jgi:hypothetical protein
MWESGACDWLLGDGNGGQAGSLHWSGASQGSTGVEEFDLQSEAICVLAKEDAPLVAGLVCLNAVNEPLKWFI